MDLRVYRRYARALFIAAKAENSLKEAEDDLIAICNILDARDDLREVLESPKVTRDKKLALVNSLFSDRARPITLRLLRLMIEKRREEGLPAVRDELIRLREDNEGILRVSIRSAVELSDSERSAIVRKMAEQTGKRIVPEYEVDRLLLGGVSVQYDNSVLDGTVSGALKRLRERLYIDVLKQA